MLVMFISVDLYTPFCIHIPLNINCHSVTLFSISCFFVLFTIVEEAQCRNPWFESAEFVAFVSAVAVGSLQYSTPRDRARGWVERGASGFECLTRRIVGKVKDKMDR